MKTFPDNWTLSASAFNLTPEVIRAEYSATDLAVSLVTTGTADAIEVELGQLWRSFPSPLIAEAAALRNELARAGGRVSIVGVSIDDWTASSRRRTDDERFAFLEPQLRASAALGAVGARLPIGQAGHGLLQRLLPLLHELDLVLFEEAQGPQTPSNPAHTSHYDEIARIDDPHIRLLLDISMLMPALPVTYLDRLERAGINDGLMRRLHEEWRDPSTTDAVVATLRSGGVPPAIHTLFMNLLVRFGRSDVGELAGVLPLIAGIHLKFWDLEDEDRRVSQPISELSTALRGSSFVGTMCSEWGGHEWLDANPWVTTQSHLALARDALAS
jgi:hypothetical protein